MSEEIAAVREALVEAITARKLIEKKLKTAKETLETEQDRLADNQSLSRIAAAEEKLTAKIRNLESMIAELETDRMAQQDLEATLKATLFQLENAVPSAQIPNLGNTNQSDEAVDRLENAILEKEAYADLLSSSREKDVKLENLAQEKALDDELAALKEAVKQQQNQEHNKYKDIKIIVTEDGE